MQFKQMVGVLGSIVLTLQLGACGAANSDAGTQETGSEAVESAPASLLAVGTLYAWYTTAQFVLATTVRTDSNDKQEEAVWMACKTNEIVVGVHFNDRKLICAKLKTGWTTISSFFDTWEEKTSVSSNPSMHGCADGAFIRAIGILGANSEHLECVYLKGPNGSIYYSSNHVHDGKGPNDNGSQSNNVYNLSNPVMHVCPKGYGMVGVHRSYNDLYCGK